MLHYTGVYTCICTIVFQPSSNMDNFREYFAKAKHIVVLTGAGISAESGVPTFSGAGGLWRNWHVQVGMVISMDGFSVVTKLSSIYHH